MIRIVALLILIVGLGAGLYLVQHPQIFKPKAYYPPETGYDPNAGKEYKLEKGFAIDVSTPEKIPSEKIFKLLGPKWVRFVYFADKGIPSSIPNDVKILIMFNNQVNPEVEKATPHTSVNFTNAWDNYVPRTDFDVWKNYTDQKFIPALDTFLKTNQRVDAIQIWNEEDFCGGSTSICIPSEAYVYMLKRSAQTIKSYERNIEVIVGGLVSQRYQYLQFMKKEDPNIFTQVDAAGIHPYGLSPNGWCECGPHNNDKSCTNPPQDNCGSHELPYGDITEVINHYKSETGLPVWITEIGQTEDSEKWQAEYFKRIFNVFSNNKVPVAIWYSWSDKMQGTLDKNDPNRPKFGLVDYEGTIKAVGIEFKHFERN